MNKLIRTARRAAGVIRNFRNDHVEVISHMDADGICAAAVISKALDRLGVDHEVKFVRMLYRDVVEDLEPADLTIFTDLGSSQLSNLYKRYRKHLVIIADHHKPEEVPGWPELINFNAHLFGVDGVQEISGAGMAYLIAREISPSNRDLAKLALIGALGDIQNTWGRLKGVNREIAETAVKRGDVRQETDILFFGRHSRPLFKALENFSDPPIPGVSGSTAGSISLLRELGIPLKEGSRWRRPVDLTIEEKQRLASELIRRAYMVVPSGLTGYIPGLIIGETFTLVHEEENSPLKDGGEFATSLNSTARHEQPLIGLEVAKGDREGYHRTMLRLLRHHRRQIARGMEFIEESGLLKGPHGFLHYFDATGEVKETFVGTLAGLTLSYQCPNPLTPVVGIVRTDGVAKISARCSKLLFLKGVDMGQAIGESARLFGGEGGGHAVACGAQIEESKVPEFLVEFENRLLDQITQN